MNTFGMVVATVGSAIALVIVLLCMIYLFESIINVWQNRWEKIRALLVRRMIFRSKYHKGAKHWDNIHELNQDIDTLNHLYQKYRLDDPFDKEERADVRNYTRANKKILY